MPDVRTVKERLSQALDVLKDAPAGRLQAYNVLMDILAVGSSPEKQRRRHRKLRVRPPDGLRTAEEAAARLACSIKTLDGYVASGALRYVPIGHGRKRVRRMFTDADLEQFIANQTRKDVPCPSIARGARRSGSLTSSSEVIAFSGLPKPRRGAKPKP